MGSSDWIPLDPSFSMSGRPFPRWILSEFDMLSALADKDVLTLVRGLSRKEARSPFPDGLFGLDGPRTNAAIRKMKGAGLISSRRDGADHVYFLNACRFRDLARFLEGLIKA